MASRIWPLKNIDFYPSPQYISYLYGPKSIPKVLSVAPHSLSVLVGGGWCYYHYPLTHIRLHCCSRPVSPHQRGHLFRHRILHRYCEPVRLVSACSISKSDDLRPAVSVCPIGGGLGVGVVTWAPSRTSDSSVLLSLSILVGGG